MEILFELISIVLLISCIVALLFTVVGLVGTIVIWIRKRISKYEVKSSRNWFKVFIRGLIALIASIVLYVASVFAYSVLPCDWGGRCVVIEDKGKVNVSNTPEVQALIQKYGKNHVHIKALDINVVQDIQFVKKIHPKFKEQTGCIIVAHAGDEGYVYQEDKQLNIIYRETIQEFMKKTKNVDPEVMAKFYLSLH
ncbi:MAG: hypothetical protein AAB600_04160 [Patescibacteria group bacterium]